MISQVLEVGPATVSCHPAGRAGPVDPDLIAAALTGIDDTTVLFREQPAAVADLWRRVIADSVETPCAALTVVHPSWWPQQRIALIVDTAATLVPDVRTVSRAEMMTAGEAATVVEIADDVVAIHHPGRPPAALPRPDDPRDIVPMIDISCSAMIYIDTPLGVAGAHECGRILRTALRRHGVQAELAGLRDIPAPVATVEPGPVPMPRRRRPAPVLAAASIAVTLCAIGIATRTHPPVPTLDAVSLVEGRIALRIPPHWAVTRITAGPGSRRIQAESPTDPDIALHVTQSYVPGETLDRTAEVLRAAVAEQPHGVFVEFNPADRRAGRPAVTYREVRIGRDIRWAVVLDGATRISIGCQSTAGHDDAVAEPCETAIESAHELGGTRSGA